MNGSSNVAFLMSLAFQHITYWKRSWLVWWSWITRINRCTCVISDSYYYMNMSRTWKHLYYLNMPIISKIDINWNKVKVVSVHAIEASTRSRYIAASILKLGIRWRWVGSLTPWLLYPWGESICTHGVGSWVYPEPIQRKLHLLLGVKS